MCDSCDFKMARTLQSERGRGSRPCPELSRNTGLNIELERRPEDRGNLVASSAGSFNWITVVKNSLLVFCFWK